MLKFSFLSWSIRQYRGSPARLEDADDLITRFDPDIFGLIEFRAKKQPAVHPAEFSSSWWLGFGRG